MACDASSLWTLSRFNRPTSFIRGSVETDVRRVFFSLFGIVVAFPGHLDTRQRGRDLTGWPPAHGHLHHPRLDLREPSMPNEGFHPNRGSRIFEFADTLQVQFGPVPQAVVYFSEVLVSQCSRRGKAPVI